MVSGVFGLSPVELLVVGVVAILLFGSRLPDVRNSLYRSYDILYSSRRIRPSSAANDAGLDRLPIYVIVVLILFGPFGVGPVELLVVGTIVILLFGQRISHILIFLGSERRRSDANAAQMERLASYLIAVILG